MRGAALLRVTRIPEAGSSSPWDASGVPSAGTPSAGSQVSAPVSIPAVVMTDGLFTVTLDFGSVFNRPGGWLAMRKDKRLERTASLARKPLP